MQWVHGDWRGEPLPATSALARDLPDCFYGGSNDAREVSYYLGSWQDTLEYHLDVARKYRYLPLNDEFVTYHVKLARIHVRMIRAGLRETR